jgi:hypothetical protein
MSDRRFVRRLETGVIRPLWAAAIIAAVTAGFTRHWWSLAAAIIAAFCLGLIGSGLHPLQTARDLAEGPLEGPASIPDERLVSGNTQLVLVGRACTRLALLLGFAVAWIAFASLHLRWFIGLPMAWLGAVLMGGFLKYRFVLSPSRSMAAELDSVDA